MIGGIALLGHPVLGISRFMAGSHDPVAQGQMFELVRLEEGVVGHGAGSVWPGSRSSLLSGACCCQAPVSTCLSCWLAARRFAAAKPPRCMAEPAPEAFDEHHLRGKARSDSDFRNAQIGLAQQSARVIQSQVAKEAIRRLAAIFHEQA